MQDEIPHFLGHRKRLKEKFLLSTNHFSDYEILEILLFYAIPRKDVKPLAKTLLKTFGSLDGVINATHDKLLSVSGITDNTYIAFSVIKEIIQRMLKQNIMHQNILSSWDALLEYLKITMGHNKTEQSRILFLNKKNILIADELQNVGTVDQTPLYPREVVKRALFHESSAIILVHNHPSGNPTPSKADITLTQSIIDACNTINVTVHDHVIISKNNFYSFKSNLLI